MGMIDYTEALAEAVRLAPSKEEGAGLIRVAIECGWKRGADGKHLPLEDSSKPC